MQSKSRNYIKVWASLVGQTQKNMTAIQMPGFDLGWENPLQKCMAVVRSSVAKSCLTLHNPMECSTSGFRVPHHLLEFVQVHVHGIKNAIQPPHALSPSPSAFNFPSIRVSFPISWLFASNGQIIEASASSPSNEYSALISFKNDWFDLLAVQGTFKSLLQHHSSKASSLQQSAFFMVQFSQL